MSEIRHIVLDLGNVLIHWQPELPFRRLIEDEARRKRFLAEICNGEWCAAIDRGKDWRQAEAEAIARFPEEAEMIRAFRRHWHEMTPHALTDTVRILDELLFAHFDVTALSNFAADTFLESLPRFEFLSRFRGITVSGRIGMIKPEAEIYARHAREFGLDPTSVLFFDDSQPNVEAARRAGWQAERFVDAVTMRADLARHGVAIGS